MTAVTAHFATTNGDIPTKSFVQFELRNYGTSIPKVAGSVIVDKVKTEVYADDSGYSRANIYSNDEITPDGTFYHVRFFQNGQLTSEDNWLINGATFDLSSQLPLDYIPVVDPPMSDTTYLRTDAGNTNLNATHPFSMGRLNDLRFSSQYAGADAGARIDAAATDIGTSKAGFIVIPPTEDDGVPTTTHNNLSFLDLRLGTQSTPTTNRRFKYPNLFLRAWDASGYHPDSEALFDNGAIPILRIEGVETGQGQLMGIYNHITAKYTGGSLGSNVVAFGSAVSSDVADNHAGIWAQNNVVNIVSGVVDQEAYGLEIDFFNNCFDAGIFPYTTSAKAGILIDSNGIYPPAVGIIVTSTQRDGAGNVVDNRYHSAFVCNAAIDVCFHITDGCDSTHGLKLGRKGAAALVGSQSALSNDIQLNAGQWTGAGNWTPYWRLQVVPVASAFGGHNLTFFSAIPDGSAGENSCYLDANGGFHGQAIQISGGALPTAAVGLRGKMWIVPGGAGVKDSVVVCAKDAADVYAWRTIY